MKLRELWHRFPSIDAWYERMRERPSVKKELLERMRPEDKAPLSFRSSTMRSSATGTQDALSKI